MNQEELQVAAFEIILNSGNARATVHEAFSEMREGHYAEAEEKLELANTELVEAHRAQTKLLQDYASGIDEDGNYYGSCSRPPYDNHDASGSSS